MVAAGRSGSSACPRRSSRAEIWWGLGTVDAEPEELLLPDIWRFLPDGYIEPQGDMRLSFQLYGFGV